MPCWRDCDPYKNDGLVRALWKQFGAVPLFPINPNISLLSVLARDSDGFHILGNVATLCKDEAKKQELEEFISSRIQVKEAKVGNRFFETNRDLKFVLELLAPDLLTPVPLVEAQIQTAKCKGVFAEDIREKCLADGVTLDDLLKNWSPDPDKVLGGQKGKMEVWVVDLIIEVKSLIAYDINSSRPTVGVGLSIPFGGGKFKLGPQQDDSHVMVIDGTEGHLPIAFRGRTYWYNKRGEKIKERRTRFAADAAHDGNSMDDDSDDNPSKHEHMGPFVEDNWYATIEV